MRSLVDAVGEARRLTHNSVELGWLDLEVCDAVVGAIEFLHRIKTGIFTRPSSIQQRDGSDAGHFLYPASSSSRRKEK